MRFIVKWLGLTVGSVLLFWFLWYDIGRFDLNNEEGIGYTLLFDLGYCAVLSLCVIAVCHCFITLLSHWMERRWAFLVASVGSLVANILIVHALELAIGLCIGTPDSAAEQMETIYICAIIATTLSMLLLSDKHYKLYIEELQERQRNERAVLRQRLDIEELRRALDKAAQNEQPTLDIETLLAHLGMAQKQYRTRFLVPVYDGVSVLEARDISHITIEGERPVAYLTGGQAVKLDENSLDEVEAMLDPSDFFRANRQYIVSIHAIARLSNFFNQTKLLHLKGYPELEIKVSKDKYGQLRQWVNS